MAKKKGKLKGIKNLVIKDELFKEMKKLQELLQGMPAIIDLGVKAGIAYYGYKAVDHPSGSLAALIAFELAKSQNIAAGAAGLATLGLIGLGSIEHKFLTPFRGGYK